MDLEDVAGADQSKPRSDEVTTTYVRSTNVLCLCGLVLGLAAMFCTWTYLSDPDSFSSSFFVPPPHASLSSTGVQLFILGTALAIVTPLSGVVQAGGLVAYAVSVMDRAAEVSAHSDGTIEFGLSVGFYAGVVSAALVLGSLVRPMGPGFGSTRVDIMRRLRVFSDGRPRRKRTYRYHGPRMKRDIAWKPKMSAADLKGFLSSRRKWVAMLVAFMLVSLVLALQQHDFLRDEPPLDTVEGGVVLELSRDKPLMVVSSWGNSRLSMNDGESYVGWTFQTTGLDGGVWSVLSLGRESIGSLNVSLTVIDRLGDGRSGPGDRLVVTAQDGTAFAEDVVYRLRWRTNLTDTRAVYDYAAWEVSFVFHDGHMDSWISQETRCYYSGYAYY
jgi:hypothetical protein